MDQGVNRLSYFFLGLGIGVAIGLLFAPKSGEETRRLIRDKAEEGREFVKKRAEEVKEAAASYIEKGKQAVARQRDQLAAAIEAGKRAYQEAVGRSPQPESSEG